jgi:hypothetical protein
MKGFAFFFLFLCLAVQSYAEEKVYTDTDLKPEPPIYSKSSPPKPQPQRPDFSNVQTNVTSGGFSEQRVPHVRPKYETKPQPQAFNPANPYPPQQDHTFEQALADVFARITLFMLIVVGIPFLIWLICLIDVLRNEFTGNNKIVWFLVVFFLPILGSILYFFIGTDHKIRPEDDEDPVVRLI